MYTVGCLQVFLSLHHRHEYITELLGFLRIRNLWWIDLVGTTLGVIQIQLSRISRSIEMEHWCLRSEHPCPEVIGREHWCLWLEHPCPKVIGNEHWCLWLGHPRPIVDDIEHWCLWTEHPCSKVADWEHWCLWLEHPCSKVVAGEHWCLCRSILARDGTDTHIWASLP